MSTLLASMGGTVRQSGPGRLHCHYPGTFISVLMLFPIVIWSVGSVAMAVGGILQGAPQLVLGALMGLLASSAFALLVRHRLRSMGTFEIDTQAGEIRRLKGQRVRERFSLNEVAAFEARWDMFHRGFEREFWLLARLKNGRQLRLGKGPRPDVQAVLELLRTWHQPVR